MGEGLVRLGYYGYVMMLINSRDQKIPELIVRIDQCIYR